MAEPNTRQDLKALHRLIYQADSTLRTIPDPHPSVPAARESLGAALALSKLLASREPDAATLGARGGNATKAANLARDPDYYRNIAGMRKTRSGGRPKREKS